MPDIKFDKRTFSDDDKKKLKMALGDNFADKLPFIAEAAFNEYIDMILDNRIFTRATDIFEYRLLQLVKAKVFGGAMANEKEVASIFLITQGKASSLINTTISKYRFDLEEAEKQFFAAILSNATDLGGNVGWMIDTSDPVKKRLNEVLLDFPTSQTIKSNAEIHGHYDIRPKTFIQLCEKYGVTKLKGGKIIRNGQIVEDDVAEN